MGEHTARTYRLPPRSFFWGEKNAAAKMKSLARRRANGGDANGDGQIKRKYGTAAAAAVAVAAAPTLLLATMPRRPRMAPTTLNVIYLWIVAGRERMKAA